MTRSRLSSSGPDYSATSGKLEPITGKLSLAKGRIGVSRSSTDLGRTPPILPWADESNAFS
jgi:hypothetical protein